MANSAGSSQGPSSIAADEEKRESVAKIAARLRMGEDLKLAYALQEEEFQAHYSKNRDQRVNIAKDRKISLEEQMAELRRLNRERMELARRDEEMALELARALEEEERRAQLERDKLDAELAKQLQEGRDMDSDQ